MRVISARIITVISLILGILVPAATTAEDASPVVVELFTSQGCSSCPPADALFAKLVGRDDVLPLAFHVDYWDYIGWKDTFAKPEYTRRQKLYARAVGERSVYTPQFVIGGQDHFAGTDPMNIAESIARHRVKPAGASLEASREGRSIRITIAPNGPRAPSSVLYLAHYIPSADVEINRGENAGRRISYSNIVTDLAAVATWNGLSVFTITVPVKDSASTAVFLQKEGYAEIIASAVAQ